MTAEVFKRRSTLFLNGFVLVLGIILIVETLIAGGGALSRGILIGMMLAVLGGLRLFLVLRRHDQ